jgi:hypothetical protein
MTDEIFPDKAAAQAMELMDNYVKRASERDLKPYLKLIGESFQRCMTLVEESGKVGKDISGDILRSVVVLNHAYLEDYLRTLAQVFLPNANENVLDDVPLADCGMGRRAEKFYLGRLARHRGKLVDEVISESVSEYMERSTFSNVTEIVSFLDVLGLKVPEVRDETKPIQMPFPHETWATLEAMIQRRHQIVHRADKGKSSLEPIDASVVLEWLVATLNLMLSVATAGFTKRHSFEEFLKRVEALKAQVDRTLNKQPKPDEPKT